MRMKFVLGLILFMSASVFPLASGTASAAPKDTCGGPGVEVSVEPGTGADRNGDGIVCEIPKSKDQRDNSGGPPRK